MNVLHSFLIVAVTALATFATRATPFILFSRKEREVPKVVLRLSDLLPPAVMAILVVYSLKEVSFSHLSLWVKELSAALVTLLIHLYKRNTLLSILVGTVLYMILVQYF
ncbi:MAG: branched-chain amino acid transporter permease [Sphaerochaetaceae bacterium]|jgi:branched-subunit amino acid transport protein AzlD